MCCQFPGRCPSGMKDSLPSHWEGCWEVPPADSPVGIDCLFRRESPHHGQRGVVKGQLPTPNSGQLWRVIPALEITFLHTGVQLLPRLSIPFHRKKALWINLAKSRLPGEPSMWPETKNSDFQWLDKGGNVVSEDRVEKETFLFIPFYNEKKKNWVMWFYYLFES